MHNSSLSPPSYGEKVERDRTGLLIHVAEIRALGNAKGTTKLCPSWGLLQLSRDTFIAITSS